MWNTHFFLILKPVRSQKLSGWNLFYYQSDNSLRTSGFCCHAREPQLVRMIQGENQLPARLCLKCAIVFIELCTNQRMLRLCLALSARVTTSRRQASERDRYPGQGSESERARVVRGRGRDQRGEDGVSPCDADRSLLCAIKSSCSCACSIGGYTNIFDTSVMICF